MPQRLRIKAALIAFAFSIALCVQARAEDVRRDINVPAGDLSTALQILARQAGVEFITQTQQLKGLRTQGVSGVLTPQEAVTKLLEGTTLQLQNIDGAMLIVPRPGDHSPAASKAETQGTGDSGGSSEIELEQVVVTGSHIRGDVPAGSKVITITREEIAASGHARLEDLLETLPQNFSGSGSEDSNAVGQNSFNINRATTVDLRGLGGGTTLILIDGHRQPAGEFYGSFVDISSIPSSAIERIEILTDGASAVYGSDAIGGVVNFILRKDYDGAETALRFGTRDGNANDKQLSQLFGKSWSDGRVLLGYQYYQRDPLKYEDHPFLADAGDHRHLGGSDLREVPASNPGIILCPSGRRDCASGQPAYAIPEGQDGTALSPGSFIPLNGVLPEGYPLGYTKDKWYLAKEELNAVFLSASQRLSDRVELFAEGRYAARDMRVLDGGVIRSLSVPSSNYYYVNPFGTTAPVNVAYNFLDDLGPYTRTGDTQTYSSTFGLTANAGGWRLTASGSYGEEKSRLLSRNNIYPTALNAAVAGTTAATALNVFGDGANTNPAVIESFRTSDLSRATNEIWGSELVADGPLFQMFDRDVRLAAGLDYRAESLDTRSNFRQEFPADTAGDVLALKRRHVSAAFAELSVPLRSLELSLAGRYEEYSDFGETFNPKIGLRWQPTQSLHLRGTWGTSFKAPKLADNNAGIAPPYVRQQYSTVGGTRYSVIIVQTLNPGLHEETADLWTAGFDFLPEALQGLRVSMTYFDIDYTDKITRPNFGTMVLNPDPFMALGLLVRSPSSSLVDTLCKDPLFTTGSCSVPIDWVSYGFQRNVSRVRVSGVDLEATYPLQTSFGAFTFGLNGAYTSRYEQVLIPGTPTFDLLDTVGYPLALRLRGSLGWAFKGLGANLFVNHTGSYENPASVLRKVDSLTTLDLNVSYRPERLNGWLASSRVSLSLVNAFDETPPFVDTFYGYDAANGDLSGRTLSLRFVKEWK